MIQVCCVSPSYLEQGKWPRELCWGKPRKDEPLWWDSVQEQSVGGGGGDGGDVSEASRQLLVTIKYHSHLRAPQQGCALYIFPDLAAHIIFSLTSYN